MYYLQSRYYDPEIGRFINADAFASTGQGVLGNNMFAYCLNNPIALFDPDGLCSYHSNLSGWVYCDDGHCNDHPNNDNVMSFFGVSSTEDIPDLPDNCMLFLENIESFTVGGITYIKGRTIVMDQDKYCVYTFSGMGVGPSVLPFDSSVTTGYVYNVNSVEDYCGIFVGISANLILDVKGNAKAPNGVYAVITGGESRLSASACSSITAYGSLYDDWQYGSAPIEWYTSPYSSVRTMPWDANTIM